jgi:hypothetical protein
MAIPDCNLQQTDLDIEPRGSEHFIIRHGGSVQTDIFGHGRVKSMSCLTIELSLFMARHIIKHNFLDPSCDASSIFPFLF